MLIGAWRAKAKRIGRVIGLRLEVNASVMLMRVVPLGLEVDTLFVFERRFVVSRAMILAALFVL